MRCFITCGKHPLKSSGGYASYVHALSSCLLKMGHDVSIIAISKNSGIEQTEIGTIYTVSDPKLPSESSTAITGSFFKWSRIIGNKLEELIDSEKERCLFFGIGPWSLSGKNLKRSFNDKVSLFGIFFTTLPHETYWLTQGVKPKPYGIKLKLKYKLVYLYSKNILKKYEKEAINSLDKIIVHYDFTKKILQEDYDVPSEKILKIPYYIQIYEKNALYSKYDKQVKTTEEKDANKMNCVSVCRQEPRKGIYYFLLAMAKIKEKNLPIKATIVGSGDLLEKNIEISKKLGLEDIVKFTGFVPDLKKIFDEADVFVQPSLQEGSGSVSVFEAMISKVPVITTYCDGLPEDIKNMENGILIPKENENELAEAIIKIYHSKELRKELVKNATKTVSEKCNINYMIKGLDEIINKLKG